MMYLLASLRPSNYHPAYYLSGSEKQIVANAFVQEAYVKFQNKAGENKPFTWTFTQERLNEYLASMDEIVANAPGHEPGEVYSAMDRYALAAPAVALDDGKITLMVRSQRYDKILSAEFSFSLSTLPQTRSRPAAIDGSIENRQVLRVSLSGVRVGNLPIPKTFVKDYLERAQQSLAKDRLFSSDHLLNSRRANPLQSGMNQLIEFISSIILVVDGGAVEPVLIFPDAHGRTRRVKIDELEIDNGKLTLHVVPVTAEDT